MNYICFGTAIIMTCDIKRIIWLDKEDKIKLTTHDGEIFEHCGCHKALVEKFYECTDKLGCRG